VVSQDRPWYEIRELENIDIVLDAVGNSEIAAKVLLVLNTRGKFISIGCPVANTSENVKSACVSHCMVSNTSQQDEIAQYYLDGSIKFLIAAKHDFTMEGLRSLFQSEGDDAGKHILRVYPYSCYLYINLKMLSNSNVFDEARTILQYYTSTTQYNSGNIYCTFQKSGNTDDFVIVQMWRNMAAMQAHLHSQQYVMFLEKWRTVGSINCTKILKDILDGFTQIRKLPTSPTLVQNFYRVYVTVTTEPHKKQDFLALIKRTLRRTKDIPGCLYFSVGQDEKDSNSFIAFWIYGNEAAYVAYRNSPDTVVYLNYYRNVVLTMSFDIPGMRRTVSY